MAIRHIVVEIDLEEGVQVPNASARIVDVQERPTTSERDETARPREKVLAEINFHRTYYYGA